MGKGLFSGAVIVTASEIAEEVGDLRRDGHLSPLGEHNGDDDPLPGHEGHRAGR